YHQTNQKTNTGKTLKPWPILVDHYNHIKKHIYENDFKAIITMISLDEDGFSLARKIVEQNKPISHSALLSTL
ncbi:hypothetical protein AB7W70_21120, partial [Providencia rettgeri]